MANFTTLAANTFSAMPGLALPPSSTPTCVPLPRAPSSLVDFLPHIGGEKKEASPRLEMTSLVSVQLMDAASKLASKADHFLAYFHRLSRVRAIESSRLMERAMGIEIIATWLFKDLRSR